MNIKELAEGINQLRIVPRLGLLYLFYMIGQTYFWYFALMVPMVEQTAVVGGGKATSAVEAAGHIINSVHTSEEERAQAKVIKQKMVMQLSLIQTEIMRVRASHRSWFVAGARPFLLWICGPGFLFSFVVNPLLQWMMSDVGAPEMPTDITMELTLAMLDLAGLRTIEKLQGFSK